MPVCLVPMAKGRPIVIDKAIVLVGRHPECDVVVSHSRKVSRKHCCLVQVDDRHVIRDLGSMNGVWLNNQRVEYEEDMTLGDEIIIGDVPYLVQQLKTKEAGQSYLQRDAQNLRETPLQPDEISSDAVDPGKKPDSSLPELRPLGEENNSQNEAAEDADALPLDDEPG